ncbi:MAG: hypothetical protein WBG86_08735, partial [Polyangiales bacterium]
GGAGAVGGSGSGGTGAIGGTGGEPGPCNTNALCSACPTSSCSSDSQCPTGRECIPSGCTTQSGGSIGECALNVGGACVGEGDDDSCPTGSTCETIGFGSWRCVKQTPGCNTDSDCVVGFSCESNQCVDRRVPCVFTEDCPVSYSCEPRTTTDRSCVRLYETCETDADCSVPTNYCEDVDGDGSKECAPSLGLNGPVCLNSSCSSPSAPVCEASEDVGETAVCGQYGLCRDADDCVAGFICAELWTDGRKECVPTGGGCDHISDCGLNQVCAAPRTGGPPACQSGIWN